MIEAIGDLPLGVTGIRLQGTVRAEERDAVLRLLASSAHGDGRSLRLLCEIGPADNHAWVEQMWHGARLLAAETGLMERCALLTDSDRPRALATKLAPWLPFRLRAFPLAARRDAIDWLACPARPWGLTRHYDEPTQVLTIELTGPIHGEDTEMLRAVMDALRMQHAGPRGVVIRVHARPALRSPGALLSLLGFLREHAARVPRIAVVTPWTRGALLACRALGAWVQPRLEVFEPEHDGAALAWAANHGPEARGKRTDPVTQAGLESFPASDPPSYSAGP